MEFRTEHSSPFIRTTNLLHTSIYAEHGFSVGDRARIGLPICIDTAVGGYQKAISVRSETTIRVREARTFSFSLHQVGGPFVDIRRVSVVGELPGYIEPPPVPPPLGMPMDRYFGLGTPIDRDDPQVTEVLRAARAGTLWIRPGFPGVCSFSSWLVDGAKMVAALASSVDRPGGFVLLEPADVLVLYGYARRELEATDLVGLVPAAAMAKFFSWTLDIQASIR